MLDFCNPELTPGAAYFVLGKERCPFLQPESLDCEEKQDAGAALDPTVDKHLPQKQACSLSEKLTSP